MVKLYGNKSLFILLLLLLLLLLLQTVCFVGAGWPGEGPPAGTGPDS